MAVEEHVAEKKGPVTKDPLERTVQSKEGHELFFHKPSTSAIHCGRKEKYHVPFAKDNERPTTNQGGGGYHQVCPRFS